VLITISLYWRGFIIRVLPDAPNPSVCASQPRGDHFVLQVFPNAKITTSEFALFLDFDGTLVDIAATPQSISVPPDLPQLIRRLRPAFEDRLCIVSGRTKSDIRLYLRSSTIDIMAEHGAVNYIRGEKAAIAPNWPASWDDPLLTVDSCIPHLVVETKRTSIALHYRQKPELEPEVMKFAEMLRSHAPSEYHVVSSNMTIEIRRHGIDKGTAIRAVMKTPRYLGKTPIFIADDVTDKPGFEAVLEMGGFSYHVGNDFGGSTKNVRDWLWQLADQNGGT
jgi:trehalose 6-phosphate phosphatase